MAPNESAMEECITASEAKRKYILLSPIMAPNVSASVSYYSSKMDDVITFFTLAVKNVLASCPFNLILLMVPQAQRKAMVDRTFKLSYGCAR